VLADATGSSATSSRKADWASGWPKKEKEGGVRWAGGGKSGLGQWAASAREGEKRPAAQGGLRAAQRKREKEMGRKKKGRGGKGKGFSFFNSFQIHFSNFQTSIKQETMHSNHDAQSFIISNFI
jgi:hypothetical protein